MDHSEVIFELATVPFLAEYATKPILTAREGGDCGFSTRLNNLNGVSDVQQSLQNNYDI